MSAADPGVAALAAAGLGLMQAGQHEPAFKVLRQAVEINPGDAALWVHLGNALIALGRADGALLGLQQALALDPNNWEAACKSGLLLHQQGRVEEALARFDLCNVLRPDHAPTLYMRAVFLRELERYDEALADNMRAHALDPGNAETCNNIGYLLQLLGRYEEALPWYDRALALTPAFVEALGNKAVVLGKLLRLDEAFAAYRRARELAPDNAVAEWNLALLQLLTGDFAAGWIGRDARWRVPSLPIVYPDFPAPLWLGESAIEGRTILIYGDEGLGDAIQFARYVPMLAERGARVILMVDAAAVSLLAGLADVAQCIPKTTTPSPAFDLQCPLSSLPRAFATRLETIPATVPYLPSPAAERLRGWEARLGSHDRLRVGLVWSGSHTHSNDANRSIPLRLLTPLLDADATFVSLQKDPRESDQAVLSERPDILDPTAALTDLRETAALISCLDLVISVDTGVAHLAGAFGRPTWILLPFAPDYRWLLDRGDSPWYPTVRLFRQDATRDWTGVIEKMRDELQGLAARFQE